MTPFRGVCGDDRTPDHPMHGDVWRSPVACRKFSVMHVCGHHDPPHVTGYWWRGEYLDPDMHDSIPLPRFLSSMTLVEREFGG